MTDYLFNAPNSRHLTYTKVLPYSPALIFNVFSDLASYPEFSTSVISSKVTSKDSAGLPTAATLRVGYPPLGLEEEWKAQAKCDKKTGVVEAWNAPTGSSGGVLEKWVMKWTISPAPTSGADKKQATVKLELELKFRSAVVDGVFAVLPAVAEKMMTKFERRVGEVQEKERKKVDAQQKEKAAKAAEVTASTDKKKNAKGPPKKLEVRSAGTKQDTGVK